MAEDVKELKEQVDYALKFKELEEEHNKLKEDFSTLQVKYNDAVITAQDLANKVMNIVQPSEEKEVKEKPTSLEDIIKNVLGGK